jgi:hypothetical protein
MGKLTQVPRHWLEPMYVKWAGFFGVDFARKKGRFMPSVPNVVASPHDY